MTFSVIVKPCGAQFAAVLVGVPEVRMIASTREEAIAALKEEIAQRVGRGELFSLEVDTSGVTDLAGKYASDPAIRRICDEAYERRNAEPSA
jgi:hypothetical protein